MPQFYSYARVSTAEQAIKGLSLQAQCKQHQDFFAKYAEPKGYTMGEIVAEKGDSAFKKDFTERPGGRKIVDVIRSGDMLVFSYLDRGFRRVADGLKKFKEWSDMGVNVVVLNFTDKGPLDTSDPMGWLNVAMGLVWSELDSRMKSRRMKDVFAHRKPRPKMPTEYKKAPVGFKFAHRNNKLIFVFDERNIEIFRKIIYMYDAGATFERIYWALVKDRRHWYFGSEKTKAMGEDGSYRPSITTVKANIHVRTIRHIYYGYGAIIRAGEIPKVPMTLSSVSQTPSALPTMYSRDGALMRPPKKVRQPYPEEHTDPQIS